ncbi:hypothetical protein JW964_25765 [candidate division KSB1 bacterium]|nr:hypothetical protein [candidate division KSB1 bacterium]
MSHKMNPFDFVPFSSDKPVVKPFHEWFALGNLHSGYLEIQIKALTPVHIVGPQDVIQNGQIISKSHFFRRNGKAYIPASSIRGVLRSFIEATCNCWSSQLTPYYLKDTGKRQIGFQVIDSKEELRKKHELDKIKYPEKFVLPEHFFMPKKLKEQEKSNLPVDLASFIFGYIPREGKEYKEVNAFKGQIIIEDAEIDSNSLVFNEKYCIPDISADAFMGGGKPSVSSWWYQEPESICLRKSKYGDAVEFVGYRYRGRKFYYHQDPQNCISWYQDSHNWPKDSSRPLYLVPMECLFPKQSTQSFKIYFDELPESMFRLLLLTLQPGKRIRHKIGYGKPYGYGSIEIIVNKMKFRRHQNESNLNLKIDEQLDQIHSALWDKEKLNSLGFGQFLHWPSIESLLKILWYSEKPKFIFSYPVFNPGYGVTEETVQSLKNDGLTEPFISALKELIGKDICTEKDFFNQIYWITKIKPTEKRKQIKKFTECVHGGFLPMVSRNAIRDVLTYQQNNELTNLKELELDDYEAKEIARKLAEKHLRSALHFEVYKECSEDFNNIQKRKIDIAETPEGDQI